MHFTQGVGFLASMAHHRLLRPSLGRFLLRQRLLYCLLPVALNLEEFRLWAWSGLILAHGIFAFLSPVIYGLRKHSTFVP